ncbi:MAG: transcription elongation factor GreA [Methanosarcinaceae archaeon]
MSEQIISKEGYDKLKKELNFLSETKRLEIAKRIEFAKELGDLSENAEYHEAKDAQAFNQGRIMDITSILKNVTIVSSQGVAGNVAMGSTILVEINGNKKKFKIVSFNEADPSFGKISNESPLGVAFLNKKKGDIVNVKVPKGELKYKILEIK